MLFHVLGQASHFLRRNAQRFGRVLTDCRYNFVVEIIEQLRRFFLYRRRRFGYRFVDARGCFFHLAVEVVHGDPSIP